MKTKLLILIATLAMTSPICAGEEKEKGSFFERPVKLEAGGKPINIKPEDAELSIKGWHACPTFHDVDSDGRVDLVSGEHFGRFWVFRNVGDNARPVYEKPYLLQAGGGDAVVPDTC